MRRGFESISQSPQKFRLIKLVYLNFVFLTNFMKWRLNSMSLDSITKNIFRNATIFLNDAIHHFNSGLDSRSNKMLTIVALQMSLELAVKYKIARDYSIRFIFERVTDSTTDAEIIDAYNNNSLRVKEFDATKNFLKSKKDENIALSEEYAYMEKFQKYRNKLVHFDYNFSLEEETEIEDDIVHIHHRMCAF